MRIALVHTRLMLRGGLETRLLSYAAHLIAGGHDVTAIVSRVAAGLELPRGLRVARIDMSLVPKPLRPLVFDLRLGALLARRPFDFVLSLARTTHQDAVVAPGNHLGYLRAIGKRFRGLSDLVQIHMDRRSFAASGVILAASRMIRDELVRDYGVDPQKIVVLHPPVDTRRFQVGLKARRAAFRSKHGFDAQATSCLFVSVSHRRKGLPLLLEVFAALEGEPFELLVAGIGRVGPRPANVKVLGFVAATEELYAAADLTLLPARYEPFGQVVAESLSTGTPVLISSWVGAQDLLSGSEGMVIGNLDPATWAGAIRGAPARRFAIDPNLAAARRIRIEDHLDAILGLTGRRTSG